MLPPLAGMQYMEHRATPFRLVFQTEPGIASPVALLQIPMPPSAGFSPTPLMSGVSGQIAQAVNTVIGLLQSPLPHLDGTTAMLQVG